MWHCSLHHPLDNAALLLPLLLLLLLHMRCFSVCLPLRAHSLLGVEYDSLSEEEKAHMEKKAAPHCSALRWLADSALVHRTGSRFAATDLGRATVAAGVTPEVALAAYAAAKDAVLKLPLAQDLVLLYLARHMVPGADCSTANLSKTAIACSEMAISLQAMAVLLRLAVEQSAPGTIWRAR